jgi:hypothetical protein
MHSLKSGSIVILKRFALVAASFSLVGLATPDARAGFFVFVTPTGATQNSLPVKAEVDVTTGAGTISVTLKNLQANPKSVAQSLSDLILSFNNTVGTTSLSSSAGQELTVNTTANNGFVLGSTVATGWILSSSASTITLDDLAAGAAGPAHTILGPPGPGPAYSNANSSIVSNGPHNPFLNQMATFTISAANVTANTQLTGAVFSFNTESGFNTTGVPVNVPEPSTMVLTGLGLGAMGLVRFVRRRRQAAA